MYWWWVFVFNWPWANGALVSQVLLSASLVRDPKDSTKTKTKIVCMYVSADHPYLQGWITKGAAQRDRPNAYERRLWLPPNGHEWSRSTAAKPDVFDLSKGQTTTPGTPCRTLLRVVCGFFNVPQLFATRAVRRDLRLIVLMREDLKV